MALKSKFRITGLSANAAESAEGPKNDISFNLKISVFKYDLITNPGSLFFQFVE